MYLVDFTFEGIGAFVPPRKVKQYGRVSGPKTCGNSWNVGGIKVCTFNSVPPLTDKRLSKGRRNRPGHALGDPLDPPTPDPVTRLAFAMPSETSDPDDALLTPREVAAAVGVTVTTVSRWARAEVLKPSALTPGGQRRYRRGDVITFQANRPKMDPGHQQMEKDAVRLYEHGWSIPGRGEIRLQLRRHAQTPHQEHDFKEVKRMTARSGYRARPTYAGVSWCVAKRTLVNEAPTS